MSLSPVAVQPDQSEKRTWFACNTFSFGFCFYPLCFSPGVPFYGVRCCQGNITIEWSSHCFQTCDRKLEHLLVVTCAYTHYRALMKPMNEL